jgi:hypothetical protein
MGEKLTDKQKILMAFDLMKGKGYVAKPNFKCCSGCACSAMTEFDLSEKGGVYWNNQDEDSFNGDMLKQDLYIGFVGETKNVAVDAAKTLIELLKDNGFENRVEWNDEVDTKICVKAVA